MEVPDHIIQAALGNILSAKLEKTNLKGIVEKTFQEYLDKRSPSPPMIDAMSIGLMKASYSREYTLMASDENFFKGLGIEYVVNERIMDKANRGKEESPLATINVYFNNPVNPMPLIGAFHKYSQWCLSANDMNIEKENELGIRVLNLGKDLLKTEENARIFRGIFYLHNKRRDNLYDFIQAEKNAQNITGIASKPSPVQLVKTYEGQYHSEK